MQHLIPLLLFKCCSDSVSIWIELALVTHLWPFSKSKFNLKSDRVILVAPASPIECLPYLPNVRAIQYKLRPERLTRLGNSNILRLPVIWFSGEQFLKMSTYTVQKVDYQNVTLCWVRSVKDNFWTERCGLLNVE